MKIGKLLHKLNPEPFNLKPFFPSTKPTTIKPPLSLELFSKNIEINSLEKKLFGIS
jgi:hypothetical protein